MKAWAAARGASRVRVRPHGPGWSSQDRALSTRPLPDLQGDPNVQHSVPHYRGTGSLSDVEDHSPTTRWRPQAETVSMLNDGAVGLEICRDSGYYVFRWSKNGSATWRG